jgi:hypothetical protein
MTINFTNLSEKVIVHWNMRRKIYVEESKNQKTNPDFSNLVLKF